MADACDEVKLYALRGGQHTAFNPLFTTPGAIYPQTIGAGIMGQALRLTEIDRIDAMIAVKADLAARIAAIDVRAP